jgi:predicted nucleic acid-binding protein
VNAVFLDTVGMIALWDNSDQWHQAAQRAYDGIKQARIPIVTTTYVLLECGNSGARRSFRPAIAIWREALYQSKAVVDPSRSDLSAAWAAYDRSEAGNAGIVDQVSFVVMRRLGIRQAFTNDEHFRAAGFETLF